MGVIKWGLAGVALFVASGAIVMGIVSVAGGTALAQVPPIERKGPIEYEKALADKLNISVETLMAAQKAARDELKTANGGRPDLGAWEQALANELGISVEILKVAQKAAFEQAVNLAVDTGRLTEQQGERLKSMGAGPGGGFGKGLGRGPGMARAAGHGIGQAIQSVISAAADALGIDDDALKEELRSGKSVAEIAAAKGIDRDDLKDDIIDALKVDIAKAQSDGKLTPEQATRLTNALEEHIDKAIDHKGGMKMGEPGRFMKPEGGPRPGFMPR